MNIIYVSNTCSQQKYSEYVERKGVRVSQQAQKYNLLLAEGLADNGASVRLISSRPINRNVEKRFWMKAEKEHAGNVDFFYVAFINYPIFRNLFVFFGVFFQILFSRSKRKSTAVVCDALNIVAAIAAVSASFLRGYQTVGIVTDVPCHFSDMRNVGFSQKLNLAVMRKFKSFLLLTEQMSQIVNPKNRPYIVLEGHADQAMEQVENTLKGKSDKKICLYAGSLQKIYGIGNLVEGFLSAAIPNAELHIYGDGDFTEELRKLAEQHPAVKYLGVAPNSEIVKAELAATLLVNPRPTNEEYTKYSFPSKNMEYMASGTPVLTTCLPGMPAEYNEYVFLLTDETAEGIAAALKDIFCRSPQQLHEKGKVAKDFILREKNNVVQAKKVLDFINQNTRV